MKVWLLVAYEIETGDDVLIGIYSSNGNALKKENELKQNNQKEYNNLCVIGPFKVDE